MIDSILVLNAGSSSLKFSIFGADRVNGGLLVRGQVEGIGTAPRFVLRSASGERIDEQTLAAGADHEQALGVVVDRTRAHLGNGHLAAVGHRVVHGGMQFADPVQIDEIVLKALERLIPLAPLHQPHNLAAVRAVKRLRPSMPQVACFDTAFHRTQPEVAQKFGLPRRFTDEGVRRYGFHGLSYEFISRALAKCDPKGASGRTVVAHLGNGASLCALLGGRSIATTMSFTPADGLLMGTRAGSLDPGVLLYLMTQHGLSAKDLENLIYHESGLLGVSEISSDMRTLLASNDPRAVEAVDLFIYRIGREIGSLVAALGGIDALVFTGGIGENAATIRARVCRDADWLGVELDESANTGRNMRISSAASKVAVWVLPTDEELMIAEHTRQLLGF